MILRFIIYTTDWSEFKFPIIGSVMPQISISDIVSVQPMNVPSGKVFYMDYKFGYIVIIFNEELWWEDDGKGGLYCPQTFEDHKISDHCWREQQDEYLVIPKWEAEQQEQYIGGLGNKKNEKQNLGEILYEKMERQLKFLDFADVTLRKK
jgi:hypothetical protein